VINLQRKKVVFQEEAPSSVNRNPVRGNSSSHIYPVRSETVLPPTPKFLVDRPLGEDGTSSKKSHSFYSHGLKKSGSKKQNATQRLYQYWVYEEITFSMNKISLLGLVLSLMFLGALFFTMGFLVAITTIPPKTESPTHPTWSQANAPAQQQSHAAPSAGGKLLGGVVGKLTHDEAIKLESRLGGGAAGKIVSHVPAPLQPFANHAQNVGTAHLQQGVAGGASSITQGHFPGWGGHGVSQQPTQIPPQQAPYPQQQPPMFQQQPLPQQPQMMQQQPYQYPQQQGQLLAPPRR
jgi:hypothetical protein